MTGSGSTAAATKTFSLPTNSPAGAIKWPESMSTMMAGMQMAGPNCTAQPTAGQQHAAVSLVNQTVAAAAEVREFGCCQGSGLCASDADGEKDRPLHQSLDVPIWPGAQS